MFAAAEHQQLVHQQWPKAYSAYSVCVCVIGLQSVAAVTTSLREFPVLLSDADLLRPETLVSRGQASAPKQWQNVHGSC